MAVRPIDTGEPLAELVGAGLPVPCLDGTERPYRDLDCAASTPAMATVAERVTSFLPSYSSVHRGAGFKSRHGDRRLRGRSPAGPRRSAAGRGTDQRRRGHHLP